MLDFFTQALGFSFMRNALVASLLISVVCGIIGTYVVINRVVFISGGIAHAAYGGIGLGYFLNFNPVLGAIIFSLGSALTMGFILRKTRQRIDTIIGVLWALGMAIGIILVDLSGGYKADLMSYLFGSILAISGSDLIFMVILDILIIILLIIFYKELLAISFDETYAQVSNVPVNTIYICLLSIIGLAIVVVMRLVGLIMVIALLTIPAAISGLFIKKMKNMMIVACLLGIIFTTTGLFISYLFNLTSGATIIMIAGIVYILALIYKSLSIKRSLTQSQ